MTRNSRRNFSPEFKLEAAQLVVVQHYTVAAAATALDGQTLGLSGSGSGFIFP